MHKVYIVQCLLIGMTGTDKVVVKFSKESFEAALHQGFFDGFRYDQIEKVWIRCDGEDRD